MEQLSLELKSAKDIRIEELEDEVDRLKNRIEELKVDLNDAQEDANDWEHRHDILYDAIDSIDTIVGRLL